MKILIITHYFPPMNSIASLRPYSWAKYWTIAGHEVTVLTTQKGKTDIDLTLPNQGFEVIEIKSQASRDTKKNADEKKNVSPDVNKKGGIRRLISRYCKRTGAILHDARYPNIFMCWKKPAIKAIVKSGKYYDVAVATYAPFATFMIALGLKKKGIVNRIVFDFRDLWTDNHLYTGIPFFSLHEKKLEKRLCDLTDKITVVSDSLADVLRKKYNVNKISVIFNGFDTDDLMTLSQEHYFDNNKINIVYTGSIYSGHRDPTPLFEAINELKKENVNLGKLNVCFVGASSNLLNDAIKRYSIDETVHCYESLPREDSLKIQRDADVLIFLEDNLTNTDGILTGKLFEYMFSGTPIWTIGRKWQPSRLVEELGFGRALGNDVQLIKKELINLLQGNIPSKYDAINIPEIQKYTRKYQAYEMLKVLKN